MALMFFTKPGPGRAPNSAASHSGPAADAARWSAKIPYGIGAEVSGSGIPRVKWLWAKTGPSSPSFTGPAGRHACGRWAPASLTLAWLKTW